jgi:hypothetical protein
MDIEEVKKKKSELENEINEKLYAFSKECGVDIANLFLERDVYKHWDGDRNGRICIYAARLVIEI